MCKMRVNMTAVIYESMVAKIHQSKVWGNPPSI